MGPRPPSSRGQDLDARTTGGRGRGVHEPPVRGRKMGSRPRLDGGRLCAGITERGMGPRIREDNWGDGFPSPSFTEAGSARE